MIRDEVSCCSPCLFTGRSCYLSPCAAGPFKVIKHLGSDLYLPYFKHLSADFFCCLPVACVYYSSSDQLVHITVLNILDSLYVQEHREKNGGVERIQGCLHCTFKHHQRESMLILVCANRSFLLLPVLTC